MDVLKIATLNINGLISRTRMNMLDDFLRRQDLDILGYATQPAATLCYSTHVMMRSWRRTIYRGQRL